MSTNHYPPLNEPQLKLVLTLYEANPDYFNHPDCPYSKEIKDLFQGELAVKYFDSHVGGSGSDELDDATTMKALTELYTKLKDYWDDVKDSDKATDKNTFFRVSASLLEKVVLLKEKQSNIMLVDSFINEVLNIMGDICTPDQRNEVIDRLAKYKSAKKD